MSKSDDLSVQDKLMGQLISTCNYIYKRMSVHRIGSKTLDEYLSSKKFFPVCTSAFFPGPSKFRQILSKTF